MGKLFQILNDPNRKRHVDNATAWGPPGSKPPTARGFSTARKRKPTKKQLAALAKGRRVLAKKYK